MTPAELTLVGVVGLFLSGLPALVRATRGRLVATALMGLSGATVLTGAALALFDPAGAALSIEWSLPFGRFDIAIDPLTALFLVPVCLVPLLGIIYGHAYLEGDAAVERAVLGRVRVFYGLLAGSLALILVARDSVLFLIAWEGMALASFFLITSDDRDDATRSAGWVYLVATHVGTLALFAFFAVLAAARGDTTIAPAELLPPATANALFVLGLVGFGLKAGLMPFHVWLPPAHAAAPTHVSAALSGVVTKLGIYGIVRMLSLLPDPPLAFGNTLVLLGALSAIGAMAFAIAQTDLKRMLAYSTIENIGVIVMGLGLAVIGRALGRLDLLALGLGGALLHTIGHSLFKPLLFFGAGAVIHATGTRDLDRMGGLARHLPRTTALFALGAVAICALPPLAGFASELFIYLGAFRTLDPVPAALGQAPAVAALVAPALALTGALALACFVRAFGAAFLGVPRHPTHTAHLHDPPRAMLVPMLLLALAITAIGLLPWLFTPLLDPVIAAFAPGGAPPTLAALAPLGWLTAGGLTLTALVALLFTLLYRRVRRTAFHTQPTWDCGYLHPTARMQYTASSFGASLVRLFPWLVRPKDHTPVVEGAFPKPTHFERLVPDLVLDTLIVPAGRWAGTRLTWLRIMQQGRMQSYILYILIVVIALFVGLSL